jgi:hypothetical protein
MDIKRLQSQQKSDHRSEQAPGRATLPHVSRDPIPGSRLTSPSAVHQHRSTREIMSTPEERLIALLIAWALTIGTAAAALGIAGL